MFLNISFLVKMLLAISSQTFARTTEILDYATLYVRKHNIPILRAQNTTEHSYNPEMSPTNQTQIVHTQDIRVQLDNVYHMTQNPMQILTTRNILHEVMGHLARFPPNVEVSHISPVTDQNQTTVDVGKVHWTTLAVQNKMPIAAQLDQNKTTVNIGKVHWTTLAVQNKMPLAAQLDSTDIHMARNETTNNTMNNTYNRDKHIPQDVNYSESSSEQTNTTYSDYLDMNLLHLEFEVNRTAKAIENLLDELDELTPGLVQLLRIAEKGMAPQVKAVTKPVWLGEGPHWDHSEQALYFVSIFDKTVNKYVPATDTHTMSQLDGMPTYIIPVEGRPHHFVVGLDRRLVEIQWSGEDGGAKVVRAIAEVDQENPNNRFNDAKADPRGRLFAGTMGYEYEPGKFHLKKGALYRFDADGTPHRLESGLDIANGLCWDVKEKAFYFADSMEYIIRRYDYDIETGNISNWRPVFRYADHGLKGIVDGMTIDTDGNLWVANFDGYQVLKIDPRTSKLLQKVPIPALQVSSATFGGPLLDTLYVTTASMNRGEEQPPPRGSLFAVTGLGVKGHPNVNVRIN